MFQIRDLPNTGYKFPPQNLQPDMKQDRVIFGIFLCTVVSLFLIFYKLYISTFMNDLSDYGILIQIIGFCLLLDLIGLSFAYEIYFGLKYGDWRKYGREFSREITDDKSCGMLLLWGKKSAAFHQDLHNFQQNDGIKHMRKIAISLVVMGLIFQF